MEPCAIALILASIHLNTDEKFNEKNLGIGVRCEQVEFGAYKNSINQLSIFTGRRWGGENLGVRAGLVTGYYKPVVPYAAGYVKMWGVELTIIPPTQYNPTTIGISYEIPL
jgi:hypothetical protein